jgi:hypothetical protein
MNITREQALPYISRCVDNALADRSIDDMPANARLVGWQCGFEPMFVAVWSYLPNSRLDDDEAAELAIDRLIEAGWFGRLGPMDPDYII